QNDVTLKMPAFEWVHVQLHQQKGMISLSPPTICNSAMPLAKEIDPNNNPSYGVLCGMSVMGFSLVLLQTAGIG
ncbi:hypothetical protein N7236_22510, partial [Escherichia coli]|nr:hypothetical protein [Escherichia coli]